MSTPRVLILTAGFGEGHNAAARALALACDAAHGPGTAHVADVFALATPRLNALTRRSYLGLINCAPRLWSATYAWIDRSTILPRGLWMLRRETRVLGELIARKIPGISTDEITAHFSLLPERYFIQTDAAEITLHIQMVNRLLKSIATADTVGSLKPVIEWKDDLNRSLTVVNVVTWDRAGLFYKLAGAFSVAGLSILGAKVISRSDHIAIDTFYVVEPDRGVVQSADAQRIFAQTVEAALVGNKDLFPDIVAQAKRVAATRPAVNGEGLHSSFPPTVDVYHELSMKRTIVEIQARDQIGLLHRLAKTISDHGFDITFARIGTERGVAIDTFYIESSEPTQAVDDQRLHALRDTLAEIIKPAPVAAAKQA